MNREIYFMKYFLLIFLFIGPSSFARLSAPFHLSYSHTGVGSLSEDFSQILNPATLGFHKRSKSALAYTIKEQNQMMSLVVTDLNTGIPLSINYERYWTSRFMKSDKDHLHVSLGTALNPFLAFGITARRETLKKHTKDTFWNGSLGALLRVSPQTGIGLTLNELLINDNINNRSATLGFYQKLLNTFSIRTDFSYSQKDKWIARGAFETLFKRFLSLRVGSTWNFQTKEVVYGAGLSFYGPRLQLDYGIEKDHFIFQHVLIFKLLI